MAVANVIAYVVVFGLPIWLVTEELIHRFAKRSAQASVPALAVMPPAEAERRVPEQAHASFV